LAQTFAILFLLRAVMGLAEGPVQPMMQTLMVSASSERRRGVNMGLLQGSAPGLMGFVIAPPLLVAIAVRLGWSQPYPDSSWLC
jgi:MFS family permease